MFLFPCIYIISFLTASYQLFNRKQEGILVFIVFALPIYITSLSIANMYGFSWMIPALQFCKELLILFALFTYIYKQEPKLHLQTVDWLVFSYLAYNLLYAILPVGSYSFTEKLIALKGISFFPLVYFVGRYCNPNEINLNKWFHYLFILAILTGVLLLFEIIPYVHFQTFTGYATFNSQFFNVEPAGHYDLTWTFESISGIKRFASFFSMPLEHAAATLISISVIAALVIDRNNKIKLTPFLLVAFGFTLLSIFFAFSRAAFASYFLMIYVYFLITKNKLGLKLIHWGMAFVVFAIIAWLQGDIYEVITTTIDFTDSSSVSHVIDWLAGIQSIGSHPLGLGLGSSGRVAGSIGDNIGGENQLIIIGVQTGIVTMILYVAIYWQVIKNGFNLFLKSKSSKARKIGLMIVLVKIGMIIPLLTAEAETYLYISYFIWFFTGLLITIVSRNQLSHHSTIGNEVRN